VERRFVRARAREPAADLHVVRRAQGDLVTAEDLPTTTLWMRLVRGGVLLTPFDGFLLRSLVRHVPAEMATVIRQQWRGLNLIQRDPEWQELRFYRLVRGRVAPGDLPNLPVRPGEVKLLSLALRPAEAGEPLHVNFWAIDRRFFNLNTSRSLRPFQDHTEMPVEAVEHCYRSNLVRSGA